MTIGESSSARTISTRTTPEQASFRIELNGLLQPAEDDIPMSSRDELAKVIANDPRYSIEAYAFILESLNQARLLKLKSPSKGSRGH